MTELPSKADIVVIGGGVMGASTAYHLSKTPGVSIVLLERGAFFGQGATGRCAGGVRYQFGTKINLQLSKLSLPMLEKFEMETGQPINYQKTGYLFLLTTNDEVGIFRKNVELQHSLGVNTEWLDNEQLREKLPFMNLDDVIAGTYYGEGGIVDPNSVVIGYINEAKRNGVRVFNNIEVVDVVIENGSITRVTTNAGSVTSSFVVNATGPWSGILCEKAGFQIPIEPLRRQWAVTTSFAGMPQKMPFTIDFGKSLYFHREGDGILTGMSNPDEKPGYSQRIDTDWELVHFEKAIERIPDMANAGVVSRTAGLYATTPDAHPILGKSPVNGFYLITGFSGHGFMHGPIAGKLLSEVILSGKAETLDISSLELKRFDEQGLIHEYNVI